MLSRINDIPCSVNVRPFEKSDLHYLINIDLKTQEQPFTHGLWVNVLKCLAQDDYSLSVGTVNGTPKAFCLYGWGEESMQILRMSSLVRTFNVLFMNDAIEMALDKGFKAIRTSVHEYESCDDYSIWIRGLGFKFLKEVKAISSISHIYGRQWNDYVLQWEI